MDDQTIKQDAGKPRLSLVPTQIIWDIAEVREYSDPESWCRVEPERYVDALYRHFLHFLRDRDSARASASGPYGVFM